MNEKIDEYIEKQRSPQKEICSKLREIILKTFPEINEEMKWGVPAYGVDEKGAKYYFVSLKDKVNLGFSIKGLSLDQRKLFDGTGKETGHIKIRSVEEIDEERIIELLKMIK